MAVTSTGLPVHQLDVSTYQQMVDSGALEGHRVELLDGIITDMEPESAGHSSMIARLTAYLAGAGERLRVQLPLLVADDSIPEPDLAVVVETPPVAEHPRTALLAVEVAHSSHQLDRGRKAELYAAAGIQQFWVVDIPGRCVEVRSSPVGASYQSLAIYRPGDQAPAPIAEADALAIADLFAGF